MEALYTMQVGATERVSVYADTSTYLLEDVIGDDFGVVVLDGPRGLSATYGNIHNLEDAIRGLADKFYRGSCDGWWDKRNRAISLYLNLLGFDSTIQMLRGYSQGDWCEVVLFRERVSGEEPGYKILDTVPYVNAWFAGDVYSIVHECLDTYVNAADPDDAITRWNEVETLYCQMLLDVRKELPNIVSIEFGLDVANLEVI